MKEVQNDNKLAIPEELVPVLAKIKHLNDTGYSVWYEVVYFADGVWNAFHGSKTFSDGEKVVDWEYCENIF